MCYILQFKYLFVVESFIPTVWEQGYKTVLAPDCNNIYQTNKHWPVTKYIYLQISEMFPHLVYFTVSYLLVQDFLFPTAWEQVYEMVPTLDWHIFMRTNKHLFVNKSIFNYYKSVTLHMSWYIVSDNNLLRTSEKFIILLNT